MTFFERGTTSQWGHKRKKEDNWTGPPLVWSWHLSFDCLVVSVEVIDWLLHPSKAQPPPTTFPFHSHPLLHKTENTLFSDTPIPPSTISLSFPHGLLKCANIFRALRPRVSTWQWFPTALKEGSGGYPRLKGELRWIPDDCATASHFTCAPSGEEKQKKGHFRWNVCWKNVNPFNLSREWFE